MAKALENQIEDTGAVCGTCQYWKQTREAAGTARKEEAGICRLKPPTVVVMKIGSPPTERALTRWPTTMKSDWCNEYKLRSDLESMSIEYR